MACKSVRSALVLRDRGARDFNDFVHPASVARWHRPSAQSDVVFLKSVSALLHFRVWCMYRHADTDTHCMARGKRT